MIRSAFERALLAASALLASSSTMAQSGLPPTSDAPEEAPGAAFGSKGQWVVLGGSNAFDISHEGLSKSSAKYFDVGGELGLDSFFIRNLSIGFDLAASYSDHQGYGATTLTETKSTALSGGVRLGFNVPLGEWLSWYPRLTLGLTSKHTETSTVSTPENLVFLPPSSASSLGPWLNLYAPLLFHPAPHFVIGFGPRIEHNFGVTRGGPYDGSQSTLVGAQLTIGGWWGGSESSDSNAPRRVKGVEQPFADQGHVVLTVATTASVLFQAYSKSKASSTTVNVAPGIDYFLVNNVSIGVDVFISHQEGTTFSSNGAQTNTDSMIVGFAPRLGVNLPLTRLLSFWPQAEVGFGTVATNWTSGLGTNEHTRTRSWVQVSAPLLIHPVSHFFVGAGPYLFHELSDADQNGYENEATTLGTSLVLGGWL